MNILKTDIVLTTDINGRKATNFVYYISSKPYSIWIINNGRQVNGKSILGLLSANLKKGDIITVCIDNGSIDELDTIKEYINK